MLLTEVVYSCGRVRAVRKKSTVVNAAVPPHVKRTCFSPFHQLSIPSTPPTLTHTHAGVVLLVLAGRSSHVRRYRAAHGERGLVPLSEVEDAGAAVAVRELPAVRTGDTHTYAKCFVAG